MSVKTAMNAVATKFTFTPAAQANVVNSVTVARRLSAPAVTTPRTQMGSGGGC